MRGRLFAAVIALAFAATFAVPMAHADTWDFSSPSGDLGSSSHTYTGSGGSLTITAYGFLSGAPGTPTNLYGKCCGVGESGLGIAGDQAGSDEISSADFVSLDMSNLVSNGIFGGTLMIGSVQSGESFMICIGSSLDTLTNCGSVIVGDGSNNGIMSIPIIWTANNDVVGITGVNKDVLVADGFSTVPEPGTLMLFGTGLLSAAGFMRRKLFS
jgi:PEP-CTERM motif